MRDAKVLWLAAALWGLILYFVPMSPVTDAIFWFGGIVALVFASIVLFIFCIFLSLGFWIWAEDKIRQMDDD